MSGLCCILAMHAMHSQQHQEVSVIACTILICATAFLVVQSVEYSHLYWGLYSAGSAQSFYVLTGVHGLHVAVGALAL